MKHLSRLDIEAIAEKYITAYMELPEVQDMPVYRIEPELFLERVLGLKIDYAHLSYDGTLLGMTSFVEVMVDTDDFNNLHTEVSYEPDYIEEICLNELRLLVREGLTMLTDTQRSRLFKYYYEGKSTLVIAQEDGVSYSKITKSLNQALEKIKKLL